MWPFTETADLRRRRATRGTWTARPGGSSGGSGAAVAGRPRAASRSAPTAPARSASRRLAAGCSASSRSAAAIPLGAGHDDAWHGLSVYGPLARTVADAALFLDATADGVPRRRLRRRPLATPARPAADRGVARALPPGALARLGARAARARSRRPPSCCARSATRCVERDSDYGPRGFGERRSRATCAASTTTPRRCRTPSAWSAARAGWRASAALVPDRGGRARRARDEAELAARVERGLRRRRRRAHARPSARARPRRRSCDGRGALWTLNAAAALRAVARRLERHGPARGLGPGRASTADGLPLAVQLVGRPHDEATLLALGGQLEAARPWADRRPPRAA